MTSSEPNPFATALLYRERGWNGTVPVAYRGKALLVKTFTGRNGGWPSTEQVGKRASSTRKRENIALRMPHDVVGIDVDDYSDKGGGDTLRGLSERFGPLPATWVSSSRGTVETVSGIRFYRLAGVDEDEASTWIEFPGVAGPGIEVIQFHHRYAIVWPSMHPEGHRYLWRDPDGDVCEPPGVDELPMLPDAWVEGLKIAAGLNGGGASVKKDGSEAPIEDVRTFLETCREGDDEGGAGSNASGGSGDVVAGKGGDTMCRYVRDLLGKLEAGAHRDAGGAAHDTVRDEVMALVGAAYDGHRGVKRALSAGRKAFIAGIADRASTDTAVGEWRRMVAGAVAMKAGETMDHVCVCDHPGKLDPFGYVVDDRPLREIRAEQTQREASVNTIAGAARDGDDPFANRDDDRDGNDGRRHGGSGDDGDEGDDKGSKGEGDKGSEGDGGGGSSVTSGGAVDERIDTDWKAGQFTDRWLAEAFSYQVCRQRFCWSAADGWFAWDGKRWKRCPDERVIEAVGRWARNKLAALVKSGTTAGTVYDAWKAVLTTKRQSDITRLAKGICEVDGAMFDQDPDLLNCLNGVVDLRTGDVHEHSPTRLITKIAGAEYRPDATHEDWDTVLTALPDDVREWMQIRYGQALTGYMTPDDRLIIQHGGGENGKSVFTSAVGRAMGDYFGLLSDRVIMSNPSDHPTELMDLRGLRLALIEETPEARRLNVQRLKKTVGTSQITARRIRQDDVTFNATHSMFLSTNYRPSIEESDHGVWRRVLLVTFPYRFRKPGEPLEGEYDRQGDPSLRERMNGPHGEGRHEAVLAWLVDGARKHQAASGVMPAVPERVLSDTRDWQRESDVVLGYIDDRIEFDLNSHVTVGDLAADLNAWLEIHGHKAWSSKLMHSRLENHDMFRQNKIESRRVRRGQRSGAGELSRPSMEETWGHLKAIPSMYRAWVGLRFQDSKSDSDDPDDPFS